ncbi:MAG: methylmalonyl Co-A mutase-associated GTPase MeaB [Anaerolineae bacterium]|nr:methylmalonyl Co-A mutase-associated GTPase MeaB [Anaerolineae bacterium]
MEKLLEDLLQGRRRALAKVLTIVENQRPEAQDVLATLFPHTGNAWVVGVTGAPGTGKSSLVNALAKAYRSREQTVGIVAVDPTSPFSGGAILGDRIRMHDLTGDSGVFIRSMATRGSLGGLAQTTRDAVRVMDAAGFDIIIVETVGAGQSEVDIVRTADTTLVIEAPGLGDDVQAIKAGILEIADLLVVNKADRPGADQTIRSLRAMLELGHPTAREQMAAHHGTMMRLAATESEVGRIEEWIPPVLKTIATQYDGIEALVEKIAEHREHIESSHTAHKRKARYMELELYERLQAQLLAQVVGTIAHETITQMIERILQRELDPQTAVEQLLLYMNEVGAD